MDNIAVLPRTPVANEAGYCRATKAAALEAVDLNMMIDRIKAKASCEKWLLRLLRGQ